ncbi:MAG: hypothetical protein AB1806_07420 [Acidobacteriota bacterium]
MTRRLAIVAMVCAAALFLPLVAGAQTPDFSGKWVQDMDKSDPAGGGRGPAGPQTVTITQTATELTIEREGRGGVQKTVYKLDGTESVNVAGRGGEAKSISKWDGAKLVTKTTRSMTNQAGEAMTIESEEVRSLEADGTMVVVTTTKSPMGEQTRKVVFKKG